MEIINVIAFMGIAVTLLGLLVTILNTSRQLNVQSFIKFTERYREIEKEIGIDNDFFNRVWRKRQEETVPEYESTELIQRNLINYAHFCSQEFYLYIRGHISIGIWSIWENEIEKNFKGGLLMEEWNNIGSNFDGYSEFHSYVKDIQNGKVEIRQADKYCTGINGFYVRVIRMLPIYQSRI